MPENDPKSAVFLSVLCADFRVGHSHGDDSVWLKLQELLESTLFLGRMFRHTGDVRRARCYLKEGRALCEKFGLLKW